MGSWGGRSHASYSLDVGNSDRLAFDRLPAPCALIGILPITTPRWSPWPCCWSFQHPLQMPFIALSSFLSAAFISASTCVSGPPFSTTPSIRRPSRPARLGAAPVVWEFAGWFARPAVDVDFVGVPTFEPVEFVVPTVFVPDAIA